MEFKVQKFEELTLDDVADTLLEILREEGKPYSVVLLKTLDEKGQLYNLRLSLERTKNDKSN